MRTQSSPSETPTQYDKGNGRKIRRLVVVVLLAVVAAHVVAGLGAALFVVARYFAKPTPAFTATKQVEMPREIIEHKRAMEEVAAAHPRQKLDNHIQSLRPSPLILPDLPKVAENIDIPVDVSESVGTASAPMTSAAGTGDTGTGFFGGAGVPQSGLLEGTMYDLKQTSDGKPTEFAGATGTGDKKRDPAYFQVAKKFVGNWNAANLKKYFEVKTKLYNPQFGIPKISAQQGPKEFKVEGTVESRYWVVLYTGRVTAPKDGTFRFVGWGDDLLIVNFAGRNVLDASFAPVFDTNRKKGLDYHFYEVEGHYKLNGGHQIGKPFTVKKGQAYDMKVLIGECGGGGMAFVLTIEDQSEKYQKDPFGNPILPLFKLRSSDDRAIEGKPLIPPLAKDVPIWAPAPASRGAF